jgi:Ni/Fe-hydrogenase subunit HybB-like protein
MNEHYAPLGGRTFTVHLVLLGIVAAIGMFYLGERFIYGLTAATNLNGGYGWGVWIVYDVVIGTALGCGGYALALVVYVMNRGHYHSLVRAALTASLFGYFLGGIGATIDCGRWWQLYNVMFPWYWNPSSVMLEVALCVMTYTLILILEFTPTILEGLIARNIFPRLCAAARYGLGKALFLILAIGVLLPSMHQSSLGSLMIAMGDKIHPLWQSLYMQPVLALATALIMGFSMVIFESSISAVGFRRPAETPLLAGLGRITVWLLVFFLVVRFVTLFAQHKIGWMLKGDFASLMFWLENGLFVFPLVVLAPKRVHQDGALLLWAAMSMLFGGIMYRFDAYLITFNPGPGFSYFPSVPEIMVSVSFVALEIMGYVLIVKHFPVLPKTLTETLMTGERETAPSS